VEEGKVDMFRIREGIDAHGGRENCSITMRAVRIRKFKANGSRKTGWRTNEDQDNTVEPHAHYACMYSRRKRGL
jgi:hypothetical protein